MKQFLIIGTLNAVTYKEVFPLIKENKVWLGVTRTGIGSMWFKVPETSPEKEGQKIENGVRYQTIGTSIWLTNLDHKKRHEELLLYKKYNAEKYPKYDNYDAIEVGKVTDIPMDYDGIAGVPITFLGKHCPEQFEIIGEMVTAKLTEYNFGYSIINGKKKYARILIKKILTKR